MQYVSPFALLHENGYLPDPRVCDDAGLLRIQKELLLELSLYGNLLQRVHGGMHEWTKDEILKLIETLRSPEDRMFHKWIYDNPRLCRLLERAEVSGEEPLYDPALADHPAFKPFQAFLSPYMSEAINRGITAGFIIHDFASVRRLLDVATSWSPAQAENVLARLAYLLEDLARAFRRMEAEITPFYISHYGGIIAYITPDFIALLNGLPESHAGLRQWLSVCLVGLLEEEARTGKFPYEAYTCVLELQCAPDLRRALIATYHTFKRVRYMLLAGKILGILVGACILVYSAIILVRFDPLAPRVPAVPEYSMHPRTAEALPTPRSTYHTYRNQLLGIVQKQLTPAGADSVRYRLLIDPQINLERTLWHHAVAGTHVSNYTPAAARPLTIVNQSSYDAVLFVVSDSALYNGFIARGESLQISIGVRDELAFYVGNNWESPGRTDVELQLGIFTKVDTTTLLLLAKMYHLSAGTEKKPLHVTLAPGMGGLQLIPENVLVETSQNTP